MQVEITVKVDGRLVKTHVQEVTGTLEQMEETIHALGKRVSNEALQASVDTGKLKGTRSVRPAAPATGCRMQGAGLAGEAFAQAARHGPFRQLNSRSLQKDIRV